MNRRSFIQQSMPFAAFPLIPQGISGLDFFRKKGFKIGACDWSIGKSSDPDGLNLAKQIGLDGLMVNMGSEKNNLHLRKKDMQQLYKQRSRETGVVISSIAIGELNNVPYKSDPRTEEWVWDSVDVARNLGVSVVLLAFFSKNDLRNDNKGRDEVVRRLKKVAPHAEKNKIILGLETYLNADEHKNIIDRVGSPNIKVYYDFRNTADAGFDTLHEFRKLGKDMICELHMKENGFLLGEGTLDWKSISDTISETGYTGDHWMQIEWAKPENADTVQSYRHNHDFLKAIFHSKD